MARAGWRPPRMTESPSTSARVLRHQPIGPGAQDAAVALAPRRRASGIPPQGGTRERRLRSRSSTADSRSEAAREPGSGSRVARRLAPGARRAESTRSAEGGPMQRSSTASDLDVRRLREEVEGHDPRQGEAAGRRRRRGRAPASRARRRRRRRAARRRRPARSATPRGKPVRGGSSSSDSADPRAREALLDRRLQHLDVARSPAAAALRRRSAAAAGSRLDRQHALEAARQRRA